MSQLVPHSPSSAKGFTSMTGHSTKLEKTTTGIGRKGEMLTHLLLRSHVRSRGLSAEGTKDKCSTFMSAQSSPSILLNLFLVFELFWRLICEAHRLFLSSPSSVVSVSPIHAVSHQRLLKNEPKVYKLRNYVKYVLIRRRCPCDQELLLEPEKPGHGSL